jgi:hypothetical protein
MLAFLLTLLTPGCGYDYGGGCEYCLSPFDMCDGLDACGWLEANDMTLEDCWTSRDNEETGAAEWECEDYSERAAKRCEKDWEELDCDELTEEGTFSSCEGVCSND